ncbi:hypothetical protein AAY473_008729 [Plecturocebus cupreus]
MKIHFYKNPHNPRSLCECQNQGISQPDSRASDLTSSSPCAGALPSGPFSPTSSWAGLGSPPFLSPCPRWRSTGPGEDHPPPHHQRPSASNLLLLRLLSANTLATGCGLGLIFRQVSEKAGERTSPSLPKELDFTSLWWEQCACHKKEKTVNPASSSLGTWHEPVMGAEWTPPVRGAAGQWAAPGPRPSQPASLLAAGPELQPLERHLKEQGQDGPGLLAPAGSE